MEFKLGDRIVGDNHPVLIVAELSCNHIQDFDLAVNTIKAMKDSGADAVKVQTYTADTITIDSDDEHFRIKEGSPWSGKTLYELYQEAYTPWEWQPKLKEIAEGLGLIFFSSPFDRKAVDFLEGLDVPAYKVASFEMLDIPLIEYIASKRKPIIMSTGIAEFSDIEEAVVTCRRMGNASIALLKCTSAYPAPLEDMNILTIPDMGKAFNAVKGLSDHTVSISVPVAAVSLGASIVEKHFILDRKIKSPDASFSLEPKEFKAMTAAIRDAEKALGKVSYELTDRVKNTREFSRSLFVVKDIKKGESFTKENIRSIRPGHGLHTRHLKDVLGRRAGQDIRRGTPLCWGLII